MGKDKKKRKRKKNEQPDFPQVMLVIFDPNVRESRPAEFLAHTKVEDAIDEDGPTRVAEYRYFREGTFRKKTIEE